MLLEIRRRKLKKMRGRSLHVYWNGLVMIFTKNYKNLVIWMKVISELKSENECKRAIYFTHNYVLLFTWWNLFVKKKGWYYRVVIWMLESYTSILILFSQKVLKRPLFDATKRNECMYFKNAKINLMKTLIF